MPTKKRESSNRLRNGFIIAIHDVKPSPNRTKPMAYGDREAKIVYAGNKAAEIDAT